jgi:hypothetical protein
MILKNRKYGNKFKYRQRAYRKGDITISTGGICTGTENKQSAY